jgi:hypothetical protein
MRVGGLLVPIRSKLGKQKVALVLLEGKSLPMGLSCTINHRYVILSQIKYCGINIFSTTEW